MENCKGAILGVSVALFVISNTGRLCWLRRCYFLVRGVSSMCWHTQAKDYLRQEAFPEVRGLEGGGEAP